MPVLINRTQKNFTMISNSILHDRELSMKDRGVLCTICSLPDGWNFSIAGLSAIVPDGIDSIRASVKKLEELGYMVRSQVRDANGKFACEIEVFTERSTASDSPSRKTRRGKPDMAEPTRSDRRGSAIAENPTQYKTDDIKPNINTGGGKSISQSAGNDRNDGLTDSTIYKKMIAENINLDALLNIAEGHSSSEVTMVHEIYDVICDMVCHPREVVRINNVSYPWRDVRNRFLKLRHEHIAGILNRLVDASLGIKNMTNYLISTLYNASLVGTLEVQASLHDDYLKYLRGNPYE